LVTLLLIEGFQIQTTRFNTTLVLVKIVDNNRNCEKIQIADFLCNSCIYNRNEKDGAEAM